jgi:hypothetical protein
MPATTQTEPAPDPQLKQQQQAMDAYVKEVEKYTLETEQAHETEIQSLYQQIEDTKTQCEAKVLKTK